jgi:pectinesterase
MDILRSNHLSFCGSEEKQKCTDVHSSTGSYKSNTVTITHGISSPVAGSLDASSTANIRSANFKAYNINFANTYGQGAQAVAVTANGNKQGFYGCSFKSYQDTLYAKAGYQYYSNCYIEGMLNNPRGFNI